MGRILVTTATIKDIKANIIISKFTNNIEFIEDALNWSFYRVTKIIAHGIEFELKSFSPVSQETYNITTTKSAEEIINGRWYIE